MLKNLLNLIFSAIDFGVTPPPRSEHGKEVGADS